MNLKQLYTLLLLSIGMTNIVQANQKLVGNPAPIFSSQAVFPDGSVDNFNLDDYLGKNIVLYIGLP